MAHGFDLADGVGVRDHLSNRDRHEIDALALEGLNAWRRVWDEALTIDGIVWPFVLELELLSHFIPVVADAVGLDRALRHYGASEVVLADDGQRTERLLAVVAPRSDLVITHAARSLKPAEWARAGRSPLPRRLRNAFFKTLTTKLGAPTRLREGNVMIVSYWPMMPLFDALLADPHRRPAVVLTAPPTGPRRSLAAARQGGFVGAARTLAARQRPPGGRGGAQGWGRFSSRDRAGRTFTRSRTARHRARGGDLPAGYPSRRRGGPPRRLRPTTDSSRSHCLR